MHAGALGSTMDRVVRRSSLSVLVLRKRTRGAYRRMAMASDWSGPSRHALPRRRIASPRPFLREDAGTDFLKQLLGCATRSRGAETRPQSPRGSDAAHMLSIRFG